MRLRGRALDTMVLRCSLSGSGDITWNEVISRRGCLLKSFRPMAMLSGLQLWTASCIVGCGCWSDSIDKLTASMNYVEQPNISVKYLTLKSRG